MSGNRNKPWGEAKYETVSSFESVSLTGVTLQQKEKQETSIKDVETSVFNPLNVLK